MIRNQVSAVHRSRLLTIFTCQAHPAVQRPRLHPPSQPDIEIRRHFENLRWQTNPRVSLPMPVLPHLLEGRPVGLGRLDRLLQLLHQARDLPQFHGWYSPGQGAGVDDSMHIRGAYFYSFYEFRSFE